MAQGIECTYYTDGAARGNPGPAAAAFVCVEDGEVTHRYARCLGRATNNVAEYRAVIGGLEPARSRGCRNIAIVSDSQLVIRQLSGSWQVKKEHLRALFDEAKERERRFETVRYGNVRRTDRYITMADALANEALDTARGGGSTLK
jgi:ribonuclease HI